MINIKCNIKDQMGKFKEHQYPTKCKNYIPLLLDLISTLIEGFPP